MGNGVWEMRKLSGFPRPYFYDLAYWRMEVSPGAGGDGKGPKKLHPVYCIGYALKMQCPADGTIVTERFEHGPSVDYRVLGEVRQNDTGRWFIDVVSLGGAQGDERMLNDGDFEESTGRFRLKT